MPTLAQALHFAQDPATTLSELRRACRLLALDPSGDEALVRARLLQSLAQRNPDAEVVCLNPGPIRPEAER